MADSLPSPAQTPPPTNNNTAAVDISTIYRDHLANHDPPISPPLAAVLALTSCISSRPFRTASEGLALLSRLTDELKRSATATNAVPISAGADTFQHQLVLRTSQPVYGSGAAVTRAETTQRETGGYDLRDVNVEDMVKFTMKAGKDFVERGIEARNRLIRLGRRFIQGGSTVIVPSRSEVVEGMLQDAADAGVIFRVLLVASDGTTNNLPPFANKLKESGVPVTVTTTEALAENMVTLSRDRFTDKVGSQGKVYVLCGAAALLADGGAVGSASNLQAACTAKAMQLEFWVAAERFKAAKQLQVDFSRHETVFDGSTGSSRRESDDSAIIPGRFITGIMTEDGPMSANAISEEMIKLWF